MPNNPNDLSPVMDWDDFKWDLNPVMAVYLVYPYFLGSSFSGSKPRPSVVYQDPLPSVMDHELLILSPFPSCEMLKDMLGFCLYSPPLEWAEDSKGKQPQMPDSLLWVFVFLQVLALNFLIFVVARWCILRNLKDVLPRFSGCSLRKGWSKWFCH